MYIYIYNYMCEHCELNVDCFICHNYECKTHVYTLHLTLILQPPHLGAGTSLQIEGVNHSLHPLITLLSGHVTWQAEGSRKLQVLSHAQSSHHNVILHVEERERGKTL